MERICLRSLPFLFMLLAVLIAGSNAAQAQLVLIPDTAMRTWLNTVAPGSVNANGELDTTNADLLAVTFAELESYQVVMNLEGLQYMTGLRRLEVRRDWSGGFSNIPLPAQLDTLWLNKLNWTTLPVLPAGLVDLTLAHCNVMNLPVMPVQLRSLRIHQCNQVATIPPLGSSLEVLNLYALTGLASFPVLTPGLKGIYLNGPQNGWNIPPMDSIPSSCTDLQFAHCNWTTLPAMPGSIKRLSLGVLPNIPAIPTLPDSLLSLYVLGMNDLVLPSALPPTCKAFEFVSNSWAAPMPPLPQSTESLYFFNDDIPIIPPLPLLLRELFVENCDSLGGLPNLPDSLRVLRVSGDPNVNELPELPSSLRSLYVYNTPVECMPWLPDSLEELVVDGTALTCLPNVPANPLLDAQVDGDLLNTLCTPLISACPWSNAVATGTVYHDVDGDGIRDAGEIGWGGTTTISFQPTGDVVMAGSDGSYAHVLDPGSHTAVVATTAPYATAVQPLQHLVTLPALAAVDSLNDFGLTLLPGIVDLAVSRTATVAVPGFRQSTWITCTNLGTDPTDGTLSVLLDGLSFFDSASVAPDVISGSSVSWDFMGLAPGTSYQVQMHTTVDSNAPLDSLLWHWIEVIPTVADLDTSNNSVEVGDTIVGGFDPNDKLVDPAVLTPAQVAAGESVSYTIRFQNTGTWVAYRVVITDTLSNDLQWSTIMPIAASHEHEWFIKNGVLHIVFDNIMLPDSNSNEPESHGFFKFSMKPVSSLVLGSTVGNIANIYFDFNEPVITNEAVFTVDDASAVNELVSDQDLRLWPSPASDVLFIAHRTERVLSVELLDLRGRPLLLAGAVDHLDVGQLAAGMYMVRVTTATATSVRSVMKR